MYLSLHPTPLPSDDLPQSLRTRPHVISELGKLESRKRLDEAEESPVGREKNLLRKNYNTPQTNNLTELFPGIQGGPYYFPKSTKDRSGQIVFL